MERRLCSWIGTLNIEDVKTIQKKTPKNQTNHNIYMFNAIL